MSVRYHSPNLLAEVDDDLEHDHHGLTSERAVRKSSGEI